MENSSRHAPSDTVDTALPQHDRPVVQVSRLYGLVGIGLKMYNFYSLLGLSTHKTVNATHL